MSASSPSLPDQNERLKAEHDIATCFLVEAAAGTGKTTLLISRILTILRRTDPKTTTLANVAAITFTEKAAGELKVKLRKRLEDEISSSSADADRFASALRELESMPVSTIHAFCHELVSRRPVEAGIEPGFTILNEDDLLLATDDFWNEWLTSELTDEQSDAARFLRDGMSVMTTFNGSSLRSLFDLLHDHRESLDDLQVAHLTDSETSLQITDFLTWIGNGAALLAECRDPNDLCAREIARVSAWHASRPTTRAFDDVLEWLNRAPDLDLRGGSKNAWSSAKTLEDAKAFRKGFYDEAEKLKSELVSREAAMLVDWLKRGVREFIRRRYERGLLDYHDLLVIARDLLKTNPTVREHFKAHFHYLLVDEFQDTDPLQTEIAFFLAEKPDRFSTDWETVELDTGKLFIVGDPKQSIYRFRRADLDLYGRVREKMQRDGEVINIRVNFRSDPRLIAEVNSILPDLMTGPTNNRYEPVYVPMEAYRTANTVLPSVALLTPPAAFQTAATSEALTAAEAACVAEYIAEQLQSGLHAAGDMAILYPTTGGLELLERALRARGIPYSISGGRDFASRSEVVALRSVLSAIDNPYDTVNVIGALRSPFLACSDDELLQHKLDGGGFCFTAERPELPHLRHCFELLRAWFERRAVIPVSSLIASIFEESCGLQIFTLKPHGDVRAANLLQVLDRARAMEQTGHVSLHELVQWLNRLEMMRSGEDSVVFDDDADAVRLMTFHKAKGLEFPLVILYRLGHGFGRIRASAFVSRTDKCVEFRGGNRKTAGFDDALADDQDREYHQCMRLLYVAMTRAKDCLILPWGWQSDRTSDKQQWLLRMLSPRYNALMESETGDAINRHDTSQYNLLSPIRESMLIDFEDANDPADIEAGRKAYDTWQHEHERIVHALNREQEFVRPSGHAVAAGVPPGAEQMHFGNRAANFGSFVHRILERVSLPDGDNLEELLAAAGDDLDQPDFVSTARQFIMHALRSDLIQRRLRCAHEYWREIPFTARVESRIIEGAIDLAFRDEHGWIIVDYKTDAVDADHVAERAELYRFQASAYAQALEAVTGVKVCETLLYFLRPNVVYSLVNHSPPAAGLD